MRNDTSNIIDLDQSFAKRNDTTIITESVNGVPTEVAARIDLVSVYGLDQKLVDSMSTDVILEEYNKRNTVITESVSKTVPNIDAILTEWSWRCDKGYPTINNGSFLIHEVKILENILSSLYPNTYFDTSILLEARPHEHLNLKYIPIDSELGLKMWGKIGIDNFEIFTNNPLYNTTPSNISVKDKLYVISTENIVKVDNKTANDLISTDSVTVWRTDAIPDTYFLIRKVKTKMVTQSKGVSATDTDIKEGLVSVFYESKITSPFDKNNFKQQLDVLQSELKSIVGLDNTSIRRIGKYISTIKVATPSASILSTLNETLSQGLAMRKAYGSGFRLDRSDVFKTIRDTASKVTGLPADKWCPGDVYLIRNGADNLIDAAVSDTLKSKNIADLNVLFLNTWGEKKNKAGGCVVACSLKMAKAQAGKAKSYLKQMGKSDFEYNVTNDERNMNLKGIIDGIIRLRKLLSNILRSNDTCKFKYSSTTSATTLAKLPEKFLREKYAALKIITSLLGKDSSDVDDNLLGAIAFGLSLSNTNPSFFKIVGDTSGRPASIQVFKAGDTIKFYSTDPTQYSQVDVIDSDTANSVQFKCKMQMGDEILDVIFQSRSNGYTQATLELQRVKPVSTV